MQLKDAIIQAIAEMYDTTSADVQRDLIAVDADAKLDEICALLTAAGY